LGSAVTAMAEVGGFPQATEAAMEDGESEALAALAAGDLEVLASETLACSL
jgi:hypothetical protein